MAKLSSIEKLKLEKFFGMGGGYILDFTNKSFQEFILDNAQIDIYKEDAMSLRGRNKKAKTVSLRSQ